MTKFYVLYLGTDEGNREDCSIFYTRSYLFTDETTAKAAGKLFEDNATTGSAYSDVQEIELLNEVMSLDSLRLEYEWAFEDDEDDEDDEADFLPTEAHLELGMKQLVENMRAEAEQKIAADPGMGSLGGLFPFIDRND